MYNTASDALNNLALPFGSGATVMPAFSWLDELHWLPALHPTRQGKAIYKYRYLVDSSESMDVTE
jgi:hypothetical protein